MRLRIENPIDRDFGMVPRGLWQMDLPFTAKALAAYLLCLRDGAVPYVAEIEAACGIGRDARRKAFAALENAGVIEWRVLRGVSGQIVAKTLIVHPMKCHAPENQAGGENHHAPEKPAGGFLVATKTENRPYIDCGSGDTLKEKKQRAAQARKARCKPAPVARPMGGGSGAVSMVLPPDVMVAYINQAKPGESREAFSKRWCKSMSQPQSAATEASPPNL